jgi:hypothetical protein
MATGQQRDECEAYFVRLAEHERVDLRLGAFESRAQAIG